MVTELVHYEAKDAVATITLDSPHNRNALSSRLVEELYTALQQSIDDDTARVIVLTGAGPVFCSGADLKEARGGGAPVTVRFPDVMTLIWNSAKPVIARLNGVARAGGLGLVAACDLRIAPDTVNFAFTEVRLGLAPAMIAVTCLRRIDPVAAAEYFLTGETFDAARAREIGLLNKAVPAEELDATVAHYVDLLVRGGPEALAITKQIVRDVPSLPVAEGFDRMSSLSASRFTSEEAAEGLAAFIEKRDPSWVIR